MSAHLPRLLSKDEMCAYLGGISAATYDQWHAKGFVPGPVRGTTRYDVKAHDMALDRLSNLDRPRSAQTALDEWRRNQAA